MIKKIAIYITLLTSCLSALTQETYDYQKAMLSAIKNGNYNLAMNIYSTAQSEDYYDLDALRSFVAQIFYIQDNDKEALKECQYLYEQDENTNLSDLIYMALLSKNTNNEILIDEITYQLGSHNFDKDILAKISVLKIKDINNIIKTINQCIDKKEPNDKNLYAYKTVLTLLYFSIDKYTEAYKSSIDYLTMDNQPVIYYILGKLRLQTGEYLSSINFLNMAINQGYNHYDAYLSRAIAYGWQKDYQRSNIDLDTCLMIDSNYYVFYLKGINYNLMRQYQDAMLCFDYCLTLNDTFALAYNYRGIVCSNLKQYAFAIKDFQRAISLDNNIEHVHNNLAIVLEKTGYLEQAIQEYKTSTKLEPYLVDSWYNLGRIYTENKQTKQAIKYLNKALDLDSEIPDIYYLLGLNYQEKKDKQRACSYFQQALELSHSLAQARIDEYCN